MSWKDMDIAIDSELEGLTPAAKLLWAALARHRNGKDGECFPKLETLMRKTCLSRRAVQRNIRLLVELGVLSVIPGSGRSSSHYELLIRHSNDVAGADQAVSSSGEEEYDTENEFISGRLGGRDVDQSSGPSELPQGPLKATSEAAQIPVRGSSEGLESGKRIEKEIREGEASTVTVPNGQRSTVGVSPTSLRDETTTTPRGAPDKTTATANTTTKASGVGLPIPLTFTPFLIGHGPIPKNFDFGCLPFDVEGSPNLDFSFLEVEARYLVNIWKTESNKPAYVEDFLRLLRKGHPYFDIQTDIQWMFRESHWASESHNHKGGWDIHSSGVFANHYDEIHSQCLLYQSKLLPEEAEVSPGADSQPDTEEDSEELEASEIQSTTSPVTSSSTSPESDDDEDFSEEIPDVETPAEPDERWNRRREVDSPRPPHRQTRPLPRLPVTNNEPPAPTEEAFYLTPKRCLSAWEKRHPGRPCNEADFDYLLDHFDEDYILFAIEHFTEYGYLSEEIRTSSDFSENFGEIMDEIRPPDAPASDDEEL